MPFDESTRDNAYAKLACQLAILVEVSLALRRLSYVDGILWKIAIQVVPCGTRQSM